jgi:hypothetical protein
MDTLMTRYRNLTVLLIVVVAQLLFLAYQVKANQDDRLIRIWAVSAVTPMAGGVEAIRHNTIGFLEDYFILLDVRDQNRRLKAENDKLRMDNIYFRDGGTRACLDGFSSADSIQDDCRACHRQQHRGDCEGGVYRSRIDERHRAGHGGSNARGDCW